VTAQRVAGGLIPLPRPTLFIGPGSSLELCARVAQLGFRRLLLVSDRDLTALDLYGGMRKRLESGGVEVVVYDGIRPDPTVEQVQRGIETFQSHGCDGVLAVGGGSVLDAAKVISVGVTNHKPILAMEGYLRVFKGGVPLLVVPTTAGTGSETTIAAVVTDGATHRKTALMDPKLVPSMAALDADLMVGLPRGTTIFTAIDAMTHAVESFLSVNAVAESDRYCVAALQMIEANLPKVLADPGDVMARQELSLAAFYAGLAFTRTNVGYVHAIAHRFGSFYQVPHGKANAIAMPHVLDVFVDRAPARLAELARRLGKSETGASDAAAARAMQRFVAAFVAEHGVPDTVAELKTADIPAIAAEALAEAHDVIHYAVAFYLDQRECEDLVARMVPS